MQSQFFTSYSPNQLSRAARTTTPNRLKTVLGEWMTKLAGSDQPHVRCQIDRQGNAKWQVWDPVNGDRQTFSDEADVRQWLESRYNR